MPPARTPTGATLGTSRVRHDRTEEPALDTRARDLLMLHAGFVVVAVALVATLPVGVAALGAVLGYELALLALASARGDQQLRRLWWFAVTLSVWQLVPDQVLVEVVGSLVFPPDGVPDVGAVTLPMAGMWAIPTVIVVEVADRVHARRGEAWALAAAAGTALVVFASAEAVLPRLGVWEPVGVVTIGTVAPYILAAEVVLGVVTWMGWRAARCRYAWATPLITALVSSAYTGAAVTSWLVLG